MWKDFFYYSRSEQKGIVVLIVILVLVIGFRIILPFIVSSPELTEKQRKFLLKGELIKDSLSKTNTISKEVVPSKISVGKHILKKETDERPLVWVDFNSVDSSFWKLYIYDAGIRDSILNFLSNYKCSKSLPMHRINEYSDGQIFAWIRKNSRLKKSEVVIEHIDINVADTTQLKKIRGIGAVLSKRIVKYRKLLGGFVSVNQLKEVYGVPAEIVDRNKDRFEVSLDNVKKIDLLKDKITDIKRHPYFEYEQVIELVNLARKNSVLKDFKANNFDTINEEQWHKMKMYLFLK